MDKLFLSGGLSFLITFFSIPVIIQVAKDKKLFDEPDERKVHKAVVPTLGGLGIFAAFMISYLLIATPEQNTELQFFIAACMVIFFLGLKDDILILSATKKFAGQLIAAFILFRFGGVQLTNMHGFLGINEIPYGLSVALSILTIVLITNSFNLIDGVDGLAGSIGTLTTLLFGLYFYKTGATNYAIMAFSLTGALISFLIYNFSPARIFMGDTGSLLVGLVNSILVIKFINLSSTAQSTFFIPSAPAIGFSVLIIPLFDTLRVFSLRILSRRSPFSPDRNHIHHFLLDLGLNHRRITGVILCTNILFISLAYLLRNSGTTTVMGILIVMGAAITYMVYHLRSRKNQLKNEETIMNSAKDGIPSHKILGLVSETVEMDQPF